MTTRSSFVAALSPSGLELDMRKTGHVVHCRLARHTGKTCQPKNDSMRAHLGTAGRWAVRMLGMVAAVILVTSHSKAAEYQLRSGDVLELAVINAPELSQRIPVEINGKATFPLIGEVQVDGISLEKLRENVRARLANSIYRPRSETAGSNVGTIQQSHVSLRVAEYRPVYVTGAVAKPGEIPFRPGLTVRQAISIAGGYDPLGARRTGLAEGPSSVTLHGELATVTVAIAEAEARIWRLRTTLGEETKFDPTKFELVDSNQSTKIIALEKAHLESFKADQNLERNYFTGAVRQSQNRVKALLRQAASEQAGAKLDEAASKKLSELFKKGLVGAQRVSQARRLVLLSTTRALQTQVAAEREKQVTRDLVSRLNRLDSISRVKLRDELTQANAKANSLRLRMTTIKARLENRGFNGSVKTIFISRRDAQKRVRANEDERLLPGDVVEVTFIPD